MRAPFPSQISRVGTNVVSSVAVIQAKPGIGDTLWHLPFVRVVASAAPGRKVTFLAPPTSLARELLTGEPTIAEVLYFAHGGNEIQRALHLFRLVRLLRRCKFQRIYIFDRTTRPAVAAWLAGIPERIGIGLGVQRVWITNGGIDPKCIHEHPVGWLTRLMATERLYLPSTEPDLRIPADALAEIDVRFGALPRPWIVFGLGASHPDKDWPDEHWRALLQRLTRDSRATMIVIGGGAWRARADRLIAGSGANVVNACDLPVMKAAALLKRADLFAGADSGALNIAAAVGTEAYGLFGMTRPLEYSRHIHIVRASDNPAQRTAMRDILPDRLALVLLPRLAALAAR